MKIREIRHICNLQTFYEVHWLLTRRCSFSCSYCPPHRHNQKSFQADKKSLYFALTRLERIVSNNKIRLNLTGGEPTIHPNFVDFIKTALKISKINAIRLVTNLASKERIYKYLVDASSDHTKTIYLVASFHWERASPERFLKNLRLLSDSKVEIQVKIMLGTNGEKKILRVIDGLMEMNAQKQNLAVAVQRIRNTQNIEINLAKFDAKYFKQIELWGDSREFFYTDKEGKMTENNPNIDLIIKNRLNTFFKWTCFTGANTLFVDNDGSVHSALCKPDFASIGNIFNDADIQIPQLVLCPHELCECSSTIRIPKIKKNENLHC
jgi:MoaA/NifB/PqqE/SkfB family radical SAM enzyme